MQTYPAGTDSAERLEPKWPSLVSTCIIVVRTRQAGLMELILRSLMELLRVKFVLVI